MKPILFSENSTTFNTNGIGRLYDAISCKVTEQRNGEYELEMEYPISGQHYSDLGLRKLICATPFYGSSLQAFRIYKISKPINGRVTVSAQHISYDLSKNVAMPFSVAAAPSACATTLASLKSKAVESCPFTFWTDVTTVASYNQTVPGSIRSRLGGVRGSVLDQYGGEYEWDNFTVKLHRQRGAVRNITLRYGKNITDVTQEENIANTVTGIVPYWSDVEGTTVVTLPEKAVYSSHASSYSNHMTVPVDFSEEFEEEPTVTALRAAANVMVNAEGFGIPKVSVDVSFVNLADSEEYKGLLPLQNVNLCDVITVQFEELGIDTTAEIIETEYDVLSEKYISIQVGDLKTTLASTITDIEKSGAQAISNTGKRVFAEASTQAQELVNNATAWLTSSGGYVVAVKNTDGSWKELLFLDTNDTRTAHNVLRINENGIGFSSNGVGGPYTQAWTLDGKLVVGGTNVPSITCYDSQGVIVFQATSSGITVGKGSISGASVTLGGSNNGSGTLTLNNANGYKVITMNNTGIHLYDGTANSVEIANFTASGIVMNKGSININDKFKVSTAGAITATSGQIGGFTIDDHNIRSKDTDSTDAGAVTLANANFSREINDTNRSKLRLAIGGGFGVDQTGKVYMYNGVIDGGRLKLGGTEDGKIEMYDDDNAKVGEWTKERLRFKSGSHTIDLMKSGGNSVIKFDGNSYIDGTGSGGGDGMHFNSPKVVFSVSDIQVTPSRNEAMYTGLDGNVITKLSTSELTGIVCNLRFDSGTWYWDSIDITYVSGWTTHKVVHGLVVE